MIGRAIAAAVPFSWMAADGVYGVGDIEQTVRRAGKGCVLGVNANHHFGSWAGKPAVAGTGAQGVAFRCLQQGGVDTSTSAGKLTLAILGAVAEFENDIRRERQKDGIERAKGRGAYLGGKATIDAAAVRQLKQDGVGASEIGRRLNIGRASVYQLLATPSAA